MERIPQGRRWLQRAILVTAGWAAMGGSAAEASRIRHNDAVTRLAPVSRLPFEAFLEAGPDLWSRATPRLPHHPLPLRLNSDGTPMASLFLDYLLYRRGLDPSRFDAHHRHIAATLALTTLPMIAPPSTTPVPQRVTPTPLTRPPTQTVPEPSTGLIALAMIAVAAAGRRWGRSPFSAHDATA